MRHVIFWLINLDQSKLNKWLLSCSKKKKKKKRLLKKDHNVKFLIRRDGRNPWSCCFFCGKIISYWCFSRTNILRTKTILETFSHSPKPKSQGRVQSSSQWQWCIMTGSRRTLTINLCPRNFWIFLFFHQFLDISNICIHP